MSTGTTHVSAMARLALRRWEDRRPELWPVVARALFRALASTGGAHPEENPAPPAPVASSGVRIYSSLRDAIESMARGRIADLAARRVDAALPNRWEGRSPARHAATERRGDTWI